MFRWLKVLLPSQVFSALKLFNVFPLQNPCLVEQFILQFYNAKRFKISGLFPERFTWLQEGSAAQ